MTNPALLICHDASGLPSLLTKGRSYRVLKEFSDYDGGPKLVLILSDRRKTDQVYKRRFKGCKHD